jgi:hypothetical protein
MLRIKGFVKPSYIIHQSKNQLGNTLIPVIIALAISAVASVAFLRQGADLSTQAKILEAQYEIADLLQYWNRIKSTKGINKINISDLPPNITTNSSLITLSSTSLVLGSLALGDTLGFQKETFTSSSGTTSDYFIIKYYLNNDAKECLTLASMFSSKMAGISNLQSMGGGTYINSGNPRCIIGLNYVLVIRLD